MSFSENEVSNINHLQVKIYREEEDSYDERMLGISRENKFKYDEENLFPYYQKIASDFVSNVAYRCLALDIASTQPSNLVLIDPADAIDLLLNERFNIGFAEAKVISEGLKKHMLLENIENKAWLLKKEGFFIAKIQSSIDVRVIFQYLEGKFA